MFEEDNYFNVCINVEITGPNQVQSSPYLLTFSTPHCESINAYLIA